uniref:Putative secreted peptide n=1 Tax=Anopheles braziliensis TaxID=58242 RepID=A0A2M3ZR27_9DIPT
MTTSPLLRPTMLVMLPLRSQFTRAHHIVGGRKRVLHVVHARWIRTAGSDTATDVTVVIHLQLLELIR